MIRAGYCTACGAKVWRTHPGREGETLLWPDPTSVYVTLEMPVGLDDAIRTPGIAYCAACAPVLGGSVVEVVPATERYAAWYQPAFAKTLVAMADHHREEPTAWLAQWVADRGGVLVTGDSPDAAHTLEDRPMP